MCICVLHTYLSCWRVCETNVSPNWPSCFRFPLAKKYCTLQRWVAVVFTQEVERPWCLALSSITLSLSTISKCPMPVPLNICSKNSLWKLFPWGAKERRKKKFNFHLFHNNMLFSPLLFCFFTLFLVYVVIIFISCSSFQEEQLMYQSTYNVSLYLSMVHSLFRSCIWMCASPLKLSVTHLQPVKQIAFSQITLCFCWKKRTLLAEESQVYIQFGP